MSHPLRMRGLKLFTRQQIFNRIWVASFTDAWIETLTTFINSPIERSHPLRMRGLKLNLLAISLHRRASHPLRMRGLKLYIPACWGCLLRRILYGCVD